MTDTPSPTRAALLERAGIAAAQDPGFSRFLAAAARATGEDDLALYRPEEIEAFFRAAHARLGQRDPARHEIHLSRSGPGGREIIDIYSADMPFIVDSVLATIRAHGGVVRFMSHPILSVDAESYRVLDTPGPGSRLESYLTVHINPLADGAARQALADELDAVLVDVARTSAGWRPMLERLYEVAETVAARPGRLSPADVAETVGFLSWLADHNFTFLGMREYARVGEGLGVRLEPVEGSGLGILADPDRKFLRSGAEYVEMTRQHVAFLNSPEPLLVTKANIRARVHRRSHMDYIGVKLTDPDGRVSGELRVLGLFTSASLSVPHTEVPLIRRKISGVMNRSGLEFSSHAGKALMHALDTYPRDELFQIAEDQLLEFGRLIAALPDRPRVRVLPRIDRFDNFVSILLFMPRDRYNSDIRARAGLYLAQKYEGRVSTYYPHFPEGELVRVHFIIGRNGGTTPRPAREDLEADIAAMSLSFGERIAAATPDPEVTLPWRAAFPAGYEADVPPARALADIATFETLSDDSDIAVRLGTGRASGQLELRFYHRSAPIPLSDRVPMLENFGFRVIDEDTYSITPADGVERFLHDMELSAPPGFEIEGEEAGSRIEAAILAVARGTAENDAFNQLALRARLNWYDVTILRALGLYLRQAGLAWPQSYLAGVLNRHAEVATALVLLFHALHDPGFDANRERAINAANDAIAQALDATTSLDEDRIIRRFLNLVEASLRTNFYQRGADGERRPALAIKFDPAKVKGLPDPRPYREIFVYAPQVEGLHLRFGPIARGGIRWSDRPVDFRTEVLGLVKAQQVKNAIIVPVGAKGAFVPKQMPAAGGREAMQAEGIAAYRIFIGALLDVTDNLKGDIVIPPPDLRRRDGDDPYLVVAADKGTATFSDIANAIAIERGYWLGDAFASGGSVGYDHKKMGITARGAWETVKRHFREMDRDIQTTPFTVAGVGDMSGDVFGNGMLLSPQTRLVAAFDHRDIFIDPDPDPATSFAERERLFGLPRSSWQDYDRSLISEGGGVFPRSGKSVDLSAKARSLLGLGEGTLTPNEVMSAILAADVDLLWFGGIGTYVRAASETDLEAGDRANDGIRITGSAIRAKVVGEGANLAMTQRGRIEYALKGGRINTDAIDNSAGVNSSDLEVNIKIALGSLVRTGAMTIEERNEFLPRMTQEVAALCLRNNYLQGLALSLAERSARAEVFAHIGLMHVLEARGQLLRDVEYLPSDEALLARVETGAGLTRPELAVLLAYAKNLLSEDLVAANLADPYLGRELYRYFPELLAETYPDTITGHRLRSAVIATVLSNAMINRGGPAFVVEMTEASSADAGQVAAAYAVARDVFGLTGINTQIDGLDGAVGGSVQLALYAEVQNLLREQTLWFLRNGTFDAGLAALVERFSGPAAELRGLLPELLPPPLRAHLDQRIAAYRAAGVPDGLSARIAELQMLSLAPDVVLVAERSGASIAEAAAAFFGVIETFGLSRLITDSEAIVATDRFDGMALDRALANLIRAERDLAADILAAGHAPVPERIGAWHGTNAAAIDRVTAAVAGLTEGDLTVSRLSVAAGLLSDLARST